MFTFNRNYDDFEQVAEWIGEFAKIKAEIMARTGRAFAYNDEFIDRIPAIANKEKRPNCGTHEDAAIYMLQCLYRAWELEAEQLDLLAKGYEQIERIDGKTTTRFKRIVLFPTRQMGGERAAFNEARVVPVPDDEGVWRPAYVLPKGKRTHGHLISDRRVLALR